MSVPLFDVLKSGYTNDKNKQSKILKKRGYNRLDKNSNDDRQTYISDDGSKVLVNINGTQNTLAKGLRDWGTNAFIAIGKGKETNRYKDEQRNLNQIRQQYPDAKITLTGHSQGGYHANKLAKGDDKVVTFNKATSLTDRNRKNEKAVRTVNDPVSALNLFAPRTENVRPSFFNNPHDLGNIKGSSLFV